MTDAEIARVPRDLSPQPSGCHDRRMTKSCFAPDVLADQVAFVTGGATGIGKEICRILGAHGARIAMASRKRENLEAAVEELAAEGIDAQFGVCDVRDPQAVRAVIDQVVNDRGRLDIVVNNAAGNFPAPMSKISPNGFKAVVDIDLLGTYNVTRAAFDACLHDRGGSIVNISAPSSRRASCTSRTSLRPRPGSTRSPGPVRLSGALSEYASTPSHPVRLAIRRAFAASPTRFAAAMIGPQTRWAFRATAPTSLTSSSTSAVQPPASSLAR
jgi:NAD(P)-dependent dehydrogenase (short-subunit alcohol dehydrogenase family)